MIIESLGVYLPERLVATADILKGCRYVPHGPFRRLTGIERRPVVGPAEYSIDLARRAVDRCLRLSRQGRETIDLVICSNISRCDGPQQTMSVEPTTASRLCAEFELKADAFDVSNACAGMFTALLLAQAAFAAGAARRALIVSGEHISHLIDTARREIESLNDPRLACLTLGDSGVAVLVEADSPPGVGFQALDLFTMGQYSGLCTGTLTDRPHGGAIMLTRSRELTEAALAHCVPHAPAMLAANGWDPGRVDAFITHQTAKLALDRARVALNRNLRRTWLDDDNFVFNVRERGNLATNSHFVALYDRARQGRLESRQRVVFSIAASGLTGGTALYALDDLPDRLRQKLNGYPSSSGSASHSGVWCPKQHIGIEAVALLGGQARRSSVVEMAAAVARDCLANAEVAMSELDVLIYCGVYRERLLSEPAVAALVLGELGGDYGANGHARLAFDISDAAVGFLKACHCAAQLIDAGRARRALVVAAELPGDPAVSFRGARPLAATASAALIASSNKTSGKFESFAFKTFAEHGRIRESFCRHADQAPELVVEAHAGYDKMATTCQAALVQTLLCSARGQFDTILSLGGEVDVAELAQLTGVAPDRITGSPSVSLDMFTSSFAQGWTDFTPPEPQPGKRILVVQAGSGLRVGAFSYQT